MNTKLFNSRTIFVTSAIVVIAISRLLPHIPNFTPLAAMALFGGAYLSDKRLAILVPLLALFISDLGLQLILGNGFHSTMPYVYAGFIITSLIGMAVGKKISVLSVTSGAILSSVLFFIITNFGVWAAYGPQTGVAGLMGTYALGIPYFAATLVGDLLYSGLLFGAFYLAQMKYPALVKSN